MSSGATKPQAANTGKKKLFPWDRIVLLVILAVGLVLVVLDYRARWQYEAALNQVSEFLPASEEIADRNPIDLEKNPTREEVRQLIGREPDADPQTDPAGSVVSETFTWNGIFRTFQFRVGYRRVFDKYRLDRVETVTGDAAQPPAERPPAVPQNS